MGNDEIIKNFSEMNADEIFINGCKAQARIFKRINPGLKSYTVKDRYTGKIDYHVDFDDKVSDA